MRRIMLVSMLIVASVANAQSEKEVKKVDVLPLDATYLGEMGVGYPNGPEVDLLFEPTDAAAALESFYLEVDATWFTGDYCSAQLRVVYQASGELLERRIFKIQVGAGETEGIHINLPRPLPITPAVEGTFPPNTLVNVKLSIAANFEATGICRAFATPYILPAEPA